MRSLDLFHPGETRAACGFQLLVKATLFIFGRSGKEQSIEAREFTFNLFVARDSFDRVDRGRVALIAPPRRIGAEAALDLKKTIIDGGGEMRAGSAALS